MCDCHNRKQDPATVVDDYEEEAKARWGSIEAYQQSTQRVSKMSMRDMEKIKSDAEAMNKALAESMDKDPKNPDVQKLIEQHYEALRNFYEPNLDMYAGLAEMYVGDERFAAYYDKYRPGLAKFMRAAMLEFVSARQ